MDSNRPHSTRSGWANVSADFTEFLIQDHDLTLDNFENPSDVTKSTFAKVDESKHTVGWTSISRATTQAKNEGIIVVLDESERNSTAFKAFTSVEIDEVEQTAGSHQEGVSIIPYTQGANAVRLVLAFSRQLPQMGLYNSLISSQIDEAAQIKSWYRNEVSKIPEVKQIVCKQNEKSIEFIVAVDRIRRKISQQLSRVEFQLYNKHTDWFFDFEHVGVRTFSQWSLNGYDNLFSRK